MHRTRTTRLAAGIAVLGLVLAACSSGGGSSAAPSTGAGESAAASAGSGDKGTVKIAINPWVGAQANVAVVKRLLETKLGYKVEASEIAEELAWPGFETGDTDAIIENWGHPELQKKYMKSKGGDGTAVNAGLTGNDGVIGWYVPPWMAEKYPDITNWKNLNKYADLFKTPESGNLGTFYDGDPGFVTNDEALVKNLNLDYKVVFTGSETALIEAFRKAEQNKTPMIGYFYEPQWFLAEVPLVKVDLPKYTPGCDADPTKVDCDYPPYPLDKIVSKSFAESGSPAYDLVKNFKWTNDDQNLVAKYIAVDKMSPEDAAAKWIEENPDKVDAWLP